MQFRIRLSSLPPHYHSIRIISYLLQVDVKNGGDNRPEITIFFGFAYRKTLFKG